MGKTNGGSQGVIMVDVVTDLAGNTYSTATFMGSVDLDPDMMGSTVLTSEGSSDIFVQKRDPNGNLLWTAHTGGNSWDSVHALVVDNSGNVYVAGRFNATADFDPGPGTINLTSEGENDSTTNAFIWKLDGNGNLVWVKQLSSVGSIGVNCMDIDGGGNVYVSGSFRGTADFDPGAPDNSTLTSLGASDGFILKLEDSPITYTSEHPTIEMSVFPNPTKGDLVIDLGAIKDKIEIEVIDAMGRTIASSLHTQENLAPYTYPVQIQSIFFESTLMAWYTLQESSRIDRKRNSVFRLIHSNLA